MSGRDGPEEEGISARVHVGEGVAHQVQNDNNRQGHPEDNVEGGHNVDELARFAGELGLAVAAVALVAGVGLGQGAGAVATALVGGVLAGGGIRVAGRDGAGEVPLVAVMSPGSDFLLPVNKEDVKESLGAKGVLDLREDRGQLLPRKGVLGGDLRVLLAEGLCKREREGRSLWGVLSGCQGGSGNSNLKG